MGNHYRVVMVDTMNGESFKFAMTYYAANQSWAEVQAVAEFGRPVVDVKQVV